jgi:hypothetical protein
VLTLAMFFLGLVRTFLMRLEMAHPDLVGVKDVLKLVNWLLQKLFKMKSLLRKIKLKK